MKRIYTTALAISAGLLLASAAHAQVTLDAVRIGAKDNVALAKFYQTAFGMQEVNRIETPGGPAIFLKYGATVEIAKANKSGPIVIMKRDSDDPKDPIAHVILSVKDMAATVAAIKAAGGSMADGPRQFRNTPTVMAFAIDPAGNRVELIQRP
ncbi:MAG TPA: VOC family protein [Bryobacteraceae bacterium]|jgi:predicted enzyme related to lactoylglutathione lyase